MFILLTSEQNMSVQIHIQYSCEIYDHFPSDAFLFSRYYIYKEAVKVS
jgi:hypothetical protein